MNTADFRAVTDAPRATGANVATVEPSHIHIPRPSRVGRSNLTHREEEAPVPMQLEPALDEAA